MPFWSKRDGGPCSVLFFAIVIVIIALLPTVVIRGVFSAEPTPVPVPSPTPGTGAEWFNWFRAQPKAIERPATGWSVSNTKGQYQRTETILIKLPGPPWNTGSELVRSVGVTYSYSPIVRDKQVVGLPKTGVRYFVSDSADIGNGPPTWTTWTATATVTPK